MIHSMTAFARQETKQSWGNATWELKAVNHRYLDTSFRMPESFRDTELSLREFIRKQLHRGKVECTLRMQLSDDELATISLNDALLEQLVAMTQTVGSKLEGPGKINPMNLLTWPGVIEQAQQDDEEMKQAIKELFAETITSLIKCRQREGDALKQAIEDRLIAIKEQVNIVEKMVPTIIESQRQKVVDRIAEITQEVDQNRLEQELVYFTQKMDVAEEMDRLVTHINEMQRVLNKGGPVGRRLDFLLQEMNREANTLGSKSQHSDTAHASVEIKVLIEQIREQVQNIE